MRLRTLTVLTALLLPQVAWSASPLDGVYKATYTLNGGQPSCPAGAAFKLNVVDGSVK